MTPPPALPPSTGAVGARGGGGGGGVHMGSDVSLPLTYGPCNSGLLHEWSGNFLSNMSALDPTALGAFTYHGYQHGAPVAATIAGFPDPDASRAFFQAVYEQDWQNGIFFSLFVIFGHSPACFQLHADHPPTHTHTHTRAHTHTHTRAHTHTHTHTRARARKCAVLLLASMVTAC